MNNQGKNRIRTVKALRVGMRVIFHSIGLRPRHVTITEIDRTWQTIAFEFSAQSGKGPESHSYIELGIGRYQKGCWRGYYWLSPT
ncbi:MAG: hypothetical protein V1763_00175 [Parcubacteria group bacterium]